MESIYVPDWPSGTVLALNVRGVGIRTPKSHAEEGGQNVDASNTRVKLIVCVLLVSSGGCASARTVEARINNIWEKHAVSVRADNPLSRCYLFGNLLGLLDRIDRELERTPQFFRDNIGPIIIEETFIDNLKVYPFPFLIRGYVDANDETERFAVHIKNRSLLEKTMLFAPRDGELFRHEASHSFQFNVVYAKHRELWLSFLEEFEGSGGSSYLPRHVGPVIYCSIASLLPPLGYIRVRGMPSLYGCLNHPEDFAETHCYLARYGGDVAFLSDSDPTLFRKCKAVEKLLRGPVDPKVSKLRRATDRRDAATLGTGYTPDGLGRITTQPGSRGQ